MPSVSVFFRPVFALVLTALVCMAHAKPAAPSIEQLAAFPKLSGFSLSPDGKRLVALEGRGEDRVILVWNTDALNKAPTVIGSSKMKISGVQFIKNDLLAVSMWQPYDARFDNVVKTFVNKLFFTDLEGKNWNEPMSQERAMSYAADRQKALSNPTVLDILPNDPDHILVINRFGSSSGDVFKVNVRGNRPERIQRSDSKIGGYVTDLDGNLAARFRQDVDSTGAFIAAEFQEPKTGKWSEHFRSYVKNRDVTEIVGFSKDPNIAFIRSNVAADKSLIYEYDIAARSRKEVLFQHRFFDAGFPLINAVKNSGADGLAFGDILGITYNGPRGANSDVLWTAPKMKALDKGIRDALGIRLESTKLIDPATGQSADTEYDLDASYSLAAWTTDLSTVVINVSGASRPPETYLFRSGKLMLLSKAYPGIDPASLGKTRLVYYKARDGLDIPAFFTAPNAELCGPAPWPAVVHPHGGPWARDTMGFDSSMWVPLLTSRCFAVLRPQFRGSQGWGRKLWMAGDAEWGQKMQDDKDDGAKWMIDQNIAQRGRIAMFGFSYGGYSAFAAAVRPNGLYKCAIAGAGVSEINKIWAQFYTNPFFREAQAPTVKGLIPLEQADKIQIPIMVYHGDRDQTVPLEQSEWFVDKAKSSKQPVVYHPITDYAHGPAWTRKIFAEQLGYIEDYLLRDCGAKGL
ncbi:MAG: prolyl oligopeptidase family serine peptidase [Burkholderiales bacterium]|nr:prolyl oligopeptidase family serine peptidase [Burkholderiales bacterium]